MCSYCGCEAEKVIATLMGEHALVSGMVYQVRQALDEGRLDEAAEVTSQISELFTRHSLDEEAGLFAQLRNSDLAVEELDRLTEDHERLRPALAEKGLVERPQYLETVLNDLVRHAEEEDTDLFPFAMQLLPNECWDVLARR
jgi:hemerythrin-like domain-containing protein